MVPAERHASALEEMQVTFPLQLDDSPQIFLAPALMAPCSPSKIAIARLFVLRSSRHVQNLRCNPSLVTSPIAETTDDGP